jgi:hypothetical protein
MDPSSLEILGSSSSVRLYIDRNIANDNFAGNKRFSLVGMSRRGIGIECFDVTIHVTPFRGLSIARVGCSSQDALLSCRFTALLNISGYEVFNSSMNNK